MDSHHCSFIKLFTLSLPLFCLLSWSAVISASTVPLIPPPSSALLAADTLRSRGYSIFASLVVSISTTTNFSGTLLAPPDFAFSFASAKFLNNHRRPPRPSIPLLVYHTLRPPLILTWPALSTRDDGDELRTFYNNNCLYLLRNSNGGEVSISSSPFKNPIAAVKIRQPDLYVDEHLTVHGIDGVLDPSFATRCSVPYIEPTADAVPLQVNRVFLDRAMRGLRRKGYNVVAAAMAIRRSDLLSLTSVTVFAVSDENLLLKPGGFRYDFRHHVLPIRQRFADFAKSAAGGIELYTLAPNKTVVVESVDGAVYVNGVAVSMTEVYHNRWIIVLSVISSLDDVDDSQLNPPITGAVLKKPVPSSPSPFSGVSTNGNLPRVPSPSPASIEHSRGNPPMTVAASENPVSSPSPFSGVFRKGNLHRVPSPAPAYTENSRGNRPISAAVSENSVPSPSPFSGVSRNGNLRRVPSPAPSYIEETEKGVPIIAPANVPSGLNDFDLVGTPSPAPELDGGIRDNAPSIGCPSSSPSPAPETEAAANPVSSPTPSPTTDDVSDTRCHLNAVVSNGVEGGDLLCPAEAVRELRETGSLSVGDVEEFKPLDARSQDADVLTKSDKVKIAENVNIADDVFYYV